MKQLGIAGAVCVGVSAAVMAVVFSAVRADREAPPDGLSAEAWSRILEQVRSAEYEITPVASDAPGAFRAPNRAQGYDARLSPGRVELTPRASDGWKWGLKLTAFGRENDMRAPGEAEAKVKGARSVSEYPGLKVDSGRVSRFRRPFDLCWPPRMRIQHMRRAAEEVSPTRGVRPPPTRSGTASRGCA